MPLLEELQNTQTPQQKKLEGIKSLFSSLSKVKPSQSSLMPQMQDTSFLSKGYNNIKNAISSLGTVTVPFGGNTRYEGFHPGVDIANKIGTPIKAFTPGVVTEVQTGMKQGDKGYGNYIVVTDPNGNKHRYSHLSQSYVRMGQPVGAGTVISSMGNTGSTYSVSGGTGSHLDYRIRDAAGRYLNPYMYLAQYYKKKYG